MARRRLLGIVLLSAGLHALGMAREPLPAQDGLKFLRVARQFQSQPFADVVRGSDQHPLYPASVAAMQSMVRALIGPGPTSWRLAAQGVSAIASLALLFPLFALTKSLFDERTAALSTLLFVLLPLSGTLGHDTLSDALALCAFLFALWLGAEALRTRTLSSSCACGIAAGLGYWVRPEVAIVPLAVIVAGLVQIARAALRQTALSLWGRGQGEGDAPPTRSAMMNPLVTRSLTCLALSFLVLVGSYALLKGEVSEKLALRRGAAIASSHDIARKPAHALPPGLDDPRWDFSPKEESDQPAHLPVGRALSRLLSAWVEGLGWVIAPLALWGAWKCEAKSGRLLIETYVFMFTVILVRHATALGYLSARHVLTLVVVALPWAAAGTLRVADRLAARFDSDPARRRRLATVALAALIATGIALQQAKPSHPSRWGHGAAGRWLAEKAGPSDAVLDTRGWAAFVAGRPSYDYWHVRQALTDAKLAYIVVGADELNAASKRADTLRAILAYAAKPVAAFSGREGGRGADVQVYRFHHPESWEGLGR